MSVVVAMMVGAAMPLLVIALLCWLDVLELKIMRGSAKNFCLVPRDMIEDLKTAFERGSDRVLIDHEVEKLIKAMVLL